MPETEREEYPDPRYMDPPRVLVYLRKACKNCSNALAKGDFTAAKYHHIEAGVYHKVFVHRRSLKAMGGTRYRYEGNGAKIREENTDE